MDPNKVPISDFPISRTRPIYDFNYVCYNTASEFVDGFDPDAVTQSPAGQYCKAGIKKLVKDIGKDPCHYRIPPPVIKIRAKLFSEGLKKYNYNAEKARKHCLKRSY